MKLYDILNFLSIKQLSQNKFSIIVKNDFRYLKNNDTFINHECGSNGLYKVARVYYNTRKNESTIICYKYERGFRLC